MEKLEITLDSSETGPQINPETEDPDKTVLRKRFKKLFNENHTVKGLEVKNTSEGRYKVDTTERKANTDRLATIGWKGNKQIDEPRPN